MWEGIEARFPTEQASYKYVEEDVVESSKKHPHTARSVSPLPSDHLHAKLSLLACDLETRPG